MHQLFKHVSQLTEEQRTNWVRATADVLRNAFIMKYLAGQVEHEGDLGLVPTAAILSEMENEALDQLAYVMELKRRLGGIRAEVIQEIEQFELKPAASHTVTFPDKHDFGDQR